MINSTQIEKIASIGSLACEAYADDDFERLILRQIQALLDTDGGVFYNISGLPAAVTFGDNYCVDIDPEYANYYKEYYHEQDPLLNYLFKRPHKSFFSSISTLHAIEDLDEYQNSEYYKDFLRPQNIHTSIIFTLGNNNGLMGLFGFQRPFNKTPYNRDSHLLAQLLAPYLILALESRQMQRAKSQVQSNLSLTKRQMDIAKYIIMGLRNHEIAAQLGIKVKTVECHLTSIYQQTHTRNRVMLARALADILPM
ncbi:MAG: helix-turn-helix transcriptional regulator [Alphaproteobacteria bacterium]|nr:helix-turn-helix transcriptional regulator [Alphaproteobacteria bacterium]MDD9841090.1 helix-turn-helix transcriptional regulator [Alphaproteobacteria bacterium]